MIENGVNLKRDLHAETIQSLKILINAGQESLQEDLENTKSNQESYISNYLDAQNRLNDLNARLTQYKEKNEIETIATEFVERLTNHKKISSFDFENSMLTIYTKDLKITYEGDTAYLPPYKVKLNCNNGSLNITTEKSSTNIHPHVYDDGRACLGNFSEIYPKLLATHNYVQVIDLLIEFLQSFNSDSPIYNFNWKNFQSTYNEPN